MGFLGLAATLTDRGKERRGFLCFGPALAGGRAVSVVVLRAVHRQAKRASSQLRTSRGVPASSAGGRDRAGHFLVSDCMHTVCLLSWKPVF